MSIEHENSFLTRFHAGHRSAIEELYSEYFDTAMRAAGRVVNGVDQETVVHEVFVKLMSSEATRQSFTGGSMAAWLSTVCRNAAVDYVRRRGRELSVEPHVASALADRRVEAPQNKLDAGLLIEQFRRREVPDKWQAVFEMRFVKQLTQREAARELGLSRTTLVYQELQLRRRLRRFVLKGDMP